MKILFSLLSPSPYLELPQGLAGWIGWLLLFALTAFAWWKWRGYNKELDSRKRGFLILLALAVPLTSLFIGFRLPPGNALPPPEMPINPQGPAVMIFSALPWMLAAGFLGVGPAGGLAFLSGLLIALWENHNPFMPLVWALVAILFAAMINQRYRTSIFRMLRHPAISALVLSFLYPLIFLITTVFFAHGVIVSRVDFALTHVSSQTMAATLQLLTGGVLAEVLARALPARWGMPGELIPSPTEKSLRARFLYGVAPLTLLLILVLMVGDWIVAGNFARRMLGERMTNAGSLAANNVPQFLDTGQNFIAELSSNPRLFSTPEDQLSDLLGNEMRRVPYFSELILLDANGNFMASYPFDQYQGSQAPMEEQIGLQLALTGVPFQIYAIPPGENDSSAKFSFVQTATDLSGSTRGVLIGRTDLILNPFTEPILTSLQNLSDIEGQGMLLDENGQILYHTSDSNLLMSTYTGSLSETVSPYYDTAPNGTRQLVYYQNAQGKPWSVVLTVPAHQAQQLALQFAIPLLGMILFFSAVAILILNSGMSTITASLKTLSAEAGRMAQGELDHPLPADGEDEVGDLRRSFEHMRASLKARMEESDRLLQVSQGVASSLDFEEAVQPILDSALATGASAARVVLSPDVIPELEGETQQPVSFSKGPGREFFRDLDEQVLALTRKQEKVVLTNPSRPRLIRYLPGAPRPEALLALALRHETLFYGSLWVVYDKPHVFSDDEIRFLSTLSSQAALAAANARLFLNAEIGRQRLAAILASTPDPVLVTDQRNRLLLANPAAWQVLGLGMDSDEGQPIENVINQKELVNLLRSSAAEKQSVEVFPPGGRVYLATASSVLAEGQRVGRVCVLRDVTHFKELDALKSEFVSTVSHDLRSPLTLMRGYATMLEMVGELNEQQTNYVRKIIVGVESMSRLVNNLLDLGRIEAGIGLRVDTISVQDVVERVVSALQLQATQKHIQITSTLSDHTTPLIEADQALLQQALHNLVENAIKYTRPGGKVLIRMQARQERMIFAVKDNGIGVSPMDQPRLFEKFYRGAQHGSKDQRGTGLGLAIVKSIAEHHGGQVWVESQLGKGSTFYLAIPIHQRVQEISD
ncbi:MAG: ATP-binding protein [Anaerolineales bacterium]|jgi:PAS domain S-box-containing protein